MAFAKNMRNLIIEEWKEYYITYKRLKRVIHKISADMQEQNEVPKQSATYQILKNSGDLETQFLGLLEQDLQKASSFLAIQFKKLQADYEALVSLGLGVIVDASGGIEQPQHRIQNLGDGSKPGLPTIPREAEDKILTLYTQTVKLQAFRDLNLHGFRKIVKKYDKHTHRLSHELADKCRETLIKAVQVQDGEDGLGILYKSVAVLLLHLIRSGSSVIPKTKSENPEERLREIKTKILTATQKSHNVLKPIPLIIAFILGMIIMLVPILPDEDRAHRCLGILAFITVLWVTEALPFFVTSISIPFLSVVCFVFADDDGNLYGAKDAASHALSKMWNDTVLLVLGGFTISMAFGQCGFELRMAAFLQHRFGNSPRIFLLAFMFLGFFLSMWISNVAAPVLCTTILLPIIADLDPEAVEGSRPYPRDPSGSAEEQKWESQPVETKTSMEGALASTQTGGGPAYHYIRGMLLGLAMACNVGGMVSPISSPQNAVAIGYLNDNKPNNTINFLQWIGISLPVCILAVLIAWGVVCLLVLPRGSTIAQVPEIVYNRKSLSLKDKFVLGVSLVTILLWCTLTATAPALGTAGMVALVPMVLFFGTGILTKQDLAGFSWNVILLLAGGNVLGNAIDNSNLLKILSDNVKPTIQGYSEWVSLLLVVCVVFLITSFVSHTVGALILMPFIVDIASDVNAIEVLVLCATFAISGAMSLPTSSFPNINSLLCDDDDGHPFLHSQDFLKYGTVAALLTLCVILTIGFGLATAMWPAS